MYYKDPDDKKTLAECIIEQSVSEILNLFGKELIQEVISQSKEAVTCEQEETTAIILPEILSPKNLELAVMEIEPTGEIID